MIPLALFALLSLLAPARAGVIVGNPTQNIVLVDGPTTYIDEIELHRCTTGSDTVLVEASVAIDDDLTVTLDTGTFCGMDLKVQIGTTWMTIPVQGFDTLQLQTSSDVVLEVELDAASESATLATVP